MIKFAPALERLLLAVVAIVLITPLSLTGLLYSFKHAPPWAKWMDHSWLRNTTLAGVEIRHLSVPFSWSGLLRADFQKYVASQFDRTFSGRELSIRLTNEAYFRLFKTSPMASTSITIGKDDWLYQTFYLNEYCLERPEKAKMEVWVQDLSRLQEVCHRLGMAFAVVVTPTKASIYPQQIPAAWQSRYDSRPRGYDLLLQLLREYGIRYVDGHVLCESAKKEVAAPIFPKGGIHAGQYGAWRYGNALLAALQAQSKPLRQTGYSELRTSNYPVGEDADFFRLLNVAVAWQYPVTQLKVAPLRVEESSRLNLVMVGGSFAETIVRQLSASEQFCEIAWYFYYKLSKLCFVDGASTRVAEPVRAVDFNREIFAADCLVLEINEESAADPGRGSLRLFLSDALSHAPSGKAEKQPYLYESLMPYRWGQEISFRAGSSQAVNPKYIVGFSGAESTGTWTDGPQATLRLAATKPDHDVLLQADVGGLMPDAETAQGAVIYLNDKRVGEWLVSTATPARHELVIPKGLIGDSGRVLLRFEILHPTSPAKTGKGPDPRYLGLSFSRLQLNLSSQGTDQ